MWDHVGEATTTAIDIVLNFIMVRARLPEIADAGWKLVIDFINAMTQALHDKWTGTPKGHPRADQGVHQPGKLALQESRSPKSAGEGYGYRSSDWLTQLRMPLTMVFSLLRTPRPAYLEPSSLNGPSGLNLPREFKKVGKHGRRLHRRCESIRLTRSLHVRWRSSRSSRSRRTVEEQRLNEIVLARPQIKPVLNMKGVRTALQILPECLSRSH